MSDKIEAQEVYCPRCDENYTLSWSDTEQKMFVTCGCNTAQPIEKFMSKFTDEYEEKSKDLRGYQ